ncbi:MAG TPA: phosphoenolpyruvate--protein phosphotransferase [Woeseiaceae bacterium]|nr:phosphoenolpyruvate--protein phosphotransferase [Woeseiaceae bacterium]
MATLTLAAPISGWVTPLEEVPDAAFAERMVGDGAAIDPVDSVLAAPCDGEIVLLADGGHAVTVRADNGAEILMHVGIDTVGLQGAGLRAHVRLGQRVHRGDPLLGLDLDRILYGAKSLVTPVVVTNGDGYIIQVRAQNCHLRVGDAFIDIESSESVRSESGPAMPLSPDAVWSLTVRHEHGIHSRPAARIARASKLLDARITVSVRGRNADARSITELMALGVRHGDSVELRGYGPGAVEAVQKVASEIPGASGPSVESLEFAKLNAGRIRGSAQVRGLVASRGIAVGVAQHFLKADYQVPETGGDVRQERAELERAIARARERLKQMLAVRENDILEAHVELLEDPALQAGAGEAIERGKSAGRAWQIAVADARESLASTGDAHLAERAADLRDVEQQVLDALTDGEDKADIETAKGAVIIAGELLPSQFARLDHAQVVGICTAEGGPTSHVALLAASMGIPAIVGAGQSVMEISGGSPLILDADEGVLYVEPSAGQIEDTRKRIADRRKRSAVWMRHAVEDCRTEDGCRIEIFANLVSEAEAVEAVKMGAEGCGLLRTEFLFLNRGTAPREEEQRAEYEKIAHALGRRPLVIRTLDAGGDKPIAYLPLPREENPLLGLRGLRSGLLFPQLLQDQLAAIMQVSPPSQCRILLPMVTDVDEIRDVKRMLNALAEERDSSTCPPVGAMIETPASVVMAQSIASEVDFLSIGSNDLAQYTLAMDRMHPQLAGKFDHFHPAVLRQIAAVCRAAEAAHCKVSVCGALASEPLAAAILIGLGVRVLSAVPNVVPELKFSIRQYRLDDCIELARSVVEEDRASSIKALAGKFHRTSLRRA